MRILAAITSAFLALAARAQESQPAPSPSTPPTAAETRAPSDATPDQRPQETAPPKTSTKKDEPKNVIRVGKRATVSFAGRAWAAAERVWADGATVGPSGRTSGRYRVSNYASYLRFGGDLDIGAGFKAFAQLETQFSIDGATSRAVPFDSGRNTGVGLKTPAGTFMLGRWDSPYKRSTSRLDPQDITGIGSYQNILGQIPSAADTSDNFFDARLSNGAQYWSPSYHGLSAKLAWVGNENRSATLDPRVLSASVTYEGPIYLSVAAEERRDCIGADDQGSTPCSGSLLGGPGKDRALRVGAGYRLEPTRTEIGVVYERIRATNEAGLRLARNAYFAGVTQGLLGDRHQLLASIGVATDVTGNVFATNDDTGAYYYTIGYQFYPVKDLNLFAFYTTIQNEKNAAYRFGSRGFGVKNGADPQGVSVGARFLF